MPRFINVDLATLNQLHLDMDEHDSSDYHNFSQTPSSAHRLPTLNGAQALLDAIEKHRPISTGLAGLDDTLSSDGALSHDVGGISRGSLTEIYGAPGCGKTHLAIQLVANALKADEQARVVWIDTSSNMIYGRLKQFLEPPQERPAGEDETSTTSNNLAGSQFSEHTPPEDRFTHLSVASLPHLLALTLYPDESFPPEHTSLLVIDNFSHIVLNGLPQNENVTSNPSLSTNDTTHSLSRENILAKAIATRRAALLSAISSGLARLTASRNIAIVVLNHTSSNRKAGGKNAVLRSALNAQQWTENVATRLVVYRDFWPAIDWLKLDKEEAKKQKIREKWPLRIVRVERVGGREVVAEGVKFVILKRKIHAVEPPKTVEVRSVLPPSSPPLPSEDNEEAMGNLELEDGEDAVDRGIRMPEDEDGIGNTSAELARVSAKRPIEEVADSEDEDELEVSRSASRLPPTLGANSGFLPSSQFTQSDSRDKSRESPLHTRRPIRNRQHVVDGHGEQEEDDEMLLQD